jgi:ATP-binding cassette subfamily B protein
MSNIVKIVKLARPFYKYLVLLSFIIVLVAILEISSSIVIKYIIDEIQKQITTGTGNIVTASWLFGITLFISLVSTLLNSLNMRLGDFTAGRIGKFLTEHFYRKVFTLSQSYFDSQISGKIVHQLNRGITNLESFLGALSNFIFPAIVQSIFIFGVLFFYSPLVGFLALPIFPMYIYVSHLSTKKWGAFQKEKNKIDDVTYGRIQEVLSNMRLVKSYNTEVKEWKFVSGNVGRSLSIYDKQSRTYHIYNFIRNLGLEILMTLIAISMFYQTFNQIITFGTLVLILQLLGQLRRPLFAASFILERIQQAEAGSKEFFDILELPSAEEYDSVIPKSTGKIQTVEFKDVTFSYIPVDEKNKGGKEDVLQHVTFTLGNNETIALVGHSGAGKTTLVNLILKFYDPSQGDIFLNGKNYKNLSHAEVRNNISLVFQENELFSTTVYDNVAYGITKVTEKEVIDALKKANAYDFVMKFPKKLQEEIGERGVKLSGGQKQRIQIARAILSNRPILILDEATSSLDAKSEKLVQDALERLMENKLVIIIAHRFSTIQNADRIIVVDEGKIVDSGNPQALSKKKGIYSELLRYQIEGNKKLLEKYEIR